MHVDPSNEVLATTTFTGEHCSWVKGRKNARGLEKDTWSGTSLLQCLGPCCRRI